MSMQMAQKIRSKTDLQPEAVHDLQSTKRLIAHLSELFAHPGRQPPGFGIVEQRSYDNGRGHHVGARGFDRCRAALVDQRRMFNGAYAQLRRSCDGAWRMAMSRDIFSTPAGLLDRCYNFPVRKLIHPNGICR